MGIIQSSFDIGGNTPLITDEGGVTFADVHSARGGIEKFTADELRALADKMDERRAKLDEETK